MILHSIDFTAGPDGGNVTSANTTSINGAQSGTNPTFNTSIPSNYTDATFSAQIDLPSGTSFNNFTFTQQSATWVGFYFMLLSNSTSITYWMSWFDASVVKIGDLRFNAGASTMSLRDNNTAVATSPTITLNTWHRAAVFCQPGSASGHQLKLFLGTNLHGTIADYDSTLVAATSSGTSNIAQIRFGMLSGSDVHYRIARMRVDTTEPTPIGLIPDTYYAEGGIWQPMVVKSADGGNWT